MGSNKSNPHHLILKINPNNQSVIVSSDIEYNSVIPKNTCCWIFFFYLVCIFPFTLFRFSKPGFKLLLRVRMFSPKLSQNLLGNYSQSNLLSKINKSSRIGNFKFEIFTRVFAPGMTAKRWWMCSRRRPFEKKKEPCLGFMRIGHYGYSNSQKQKALPAARTPADSNT